MTRLEMEFTEALLESLAAAEQLTGIPEAQLAEQARRLGGPEAVRRLLARGSVTRQFAALKARKRLDLTPEALVIQGRFTELFTDREADQCLSTLLEAGMF